ncbi:hypothetical protein FA15DRAFT_704530 [Coprinopsis marcescibilis]|uniref:C2H2-type domain-containing protein n=1 Tax=Coprinopsis marcescibilis TaxID=230819 RepID=A0A5C3KW37_COPMA|nr:hypothetical protein FA15DRAFT_704530 [Coprinopsis marcescibilis]
MGRATKAALTAALKSFECLDCGKVCRSQWGLRQHRTALHPLPVTVHPTAKEPKETPTVKQYHPHLTGIPVDHHGNPLLKHVKPTLESPLDSSNPWAPFEDRLSFDWAHYHFVELQSSEANICRGLDLWAATRLMATHDPHDARAPWSSVKDMYKSIDNIQHGSAPFSTVTFEYSGPFPDNPPTWMTQPYELCVRDAREVLRNQLSTAEFVDQFETRPYRQFEKEGEKQRVWTNLMSGEWAWEEADTIFSDVYGSEGAMLVPVVSGLDKTTVSVATGHQEYHPFYISAGNLTNTARRSHANGVVPVAFLPIPKATKNEKKTPEYARFVRQMYHACIARIFLPLRAGMTVPEIVRCPDGHLRRAIYSIGPVIADYPEQVWLSAIVQNWCAKCMAKPDDLDNPDARQRTHKKTDILIECFDPGILWKSFGVRADVVPFTYNFPRADIHKLMAPDLLHQVIKGTFKDHLVEWVMAYLVNLHGDSKAADIIAEIDRRVSAVPIFPGLRRFKDGRNFSQWTGDDSKALMKVYLGAFAEFVPDKMVQCMAAFLNVCYIFRRNAITSTALKLAELELAKFHILRNVFLETETRAHCSMPRQHALKHFPHLIRQFGSPNGLCSSITESRHITAVKEPWRRSNRYNALPQMLLTITRLDKFHALRQIFADHGMLAGTTTFYTALTLAGRNDYNADEDNGLADGYGDANAPASEDPDQAQLRDVSPQPGPRFTEFIEMASRHGKSTGYPSTLPELTCHAHVREPRLSRALLEYLFAVQNPEAPIPLDIATRFTIQGNIRVYHSASANFYAPSDACGAGGMQRQILRSNPNWKGHPRRDTVFVSQGNTPTICGMRVAQVRMFFSITDPGSDAPQLYAFVDWFNTVGNRPDPVTGMWVVERSTSQVNRVLSVIPLSSIIRGAHLIPIYGAKFLPERFSFTKSLDVFSQFYVNSYADHHTHELLSDL